MATDDPGPKDPGKSSSAPPSDPVTPRPLTIDDVPRLGSGAGIAVGCSVAVAVMVVLFWLVRGWFFHAP